MENKYFTPDIEDIRVGYEGEYHNWCMDERGKPELNYNRWDRTILKNHHVETMLKYGINHFRVPYLTKEQIEAEGWIEKHAGFFKKGDFLMSNITDFNGIIIRKDSWDPEETKYSGECKDINTFRWVCKLLNI